MIEMMAIVETGSFDRALGLAMKWSSRAPAKIITDTARGVTFKAMAYTPAVDVQTIDTDLDVVVTPVIGKRGQVLSQRYAKNRNYVARGGGAGDEPFGNVPLAWLLIGSRAKQESEYNIATSWRWMIAGAHPLKGHKVSEFYEIMRDLVSRMVKGRHSSTHFLQAGWGAVTKKLRSLPYGSPVIEGVDLNRPVDADLGDVKYGTTEGQFWMLLENKIGTSGPGDALNEKRNAALFLYGEPALQRALDEQARELETRYLPRAAEELKAEWESV